MFRTKFGHGKSQFRFWAAVRYMHNPFSGYIIIFLSRTVNNTAQASLSHFWCNFPPLSRILPLKSNLFFVCQRFSLFLFLRRRLPAQYLFLQITHKVYLCIILLFIIWSIHFCRYPPVVLLSRSSVRFRKKGVKNIAQCIKIPRKHICKAFLLAWCS